MQQQYLIAVRFCCIQNNKLNLSIALAVVIPVIQPTKLTLRQRVDCACLCLRNDEREHIKKNDIIQARMQAWVLGGTL